MELGTVSRESSENQVGHQHTHFSSLLFDFSPVFWHLDFHFFDLHTFSYFCGWEEGAMVVFYAVAQCALLLEKRN